MRLISVIAIIATTIGCASTSEQASYTNPYSEPVAVVPAAVESPTEDAEPVQDLADAFEPTFALVHQSDSWSTVHSVAVNDVGTIAHGQMGSGIACDITTANGSIGNDYYESGTQEVDDIGVIQGIGEAFLVHTPHVIMLRRPGMGTESFRHAMPGVLAGQLASDQIVVSRSTDLGCEVSWIHINEDKVSTRLLEDTLVCDQLAVDPVSGDAWLATEAGVFSVRIGSDVLIDASPLALVAYDPVSTRLAIASGDKLRHENVDGSDAVLSSIGGEVLDLSAAPGLGAFALGVDRFPALSTVELVDAADATLLASMPVLQDPLGVTVSGSGNKIAVRNSSNVAFFSVVPVN